MMTWLSKYERVLTRARLSGPGPRVTRRSVISSDVSWRDIMSYHLPYNFPCLADAKGLFVFLSCINTGQYSFIEENLNFIAGKEFSSQYEISGEIASVSQK